MKPAVLTLTLILLGGGIASLGAQGPPLSEIGRKAYELVDGNDYSGAISLLESHREEGLNPVELAMLGTLYLEVGRAAEAAETLAPLAEREDADAAVLYNLGRARLAMGSREAAARYFERSVAQVPISPAARELGLLWGAQGRSFDAYRLLHPWARQNPDDHEARIAAAACALHLEREKEAEEMISGLPETNPKVVMLRGQILLRSGKPEEAVSLLRPFFETAPWEIRPDLTRLLADAYLLLGRSQDALALVPEGPGDDVRLAITLATAHYRQGDVDQALVTLGPFASTLPERHKSGDPTPPLAPTLTFEYGRLLVAAGRGEEALPFLETATALFPENAAAWKSLGDALLSAGRRDEALEARIKFRDLSAAENERRREVQAQRSVKDPIVRNVLRAQEALSQGDGEEALEILRREIQLSPQDLRLYLSEVTTLLKLERIDEALERAALTFERFPGRPDASYQRAVVHLTLEQTAAAEADLRRTLELAPQHTAAMNDLAVILSVRGEKEEARRLLERVLELSPEDELARQNLVQLKKAGS